MLEHKLIHIEPDGANRIAESTNFRKLQGLLDEGWHVVNMIPQKVAAGGEFHSCVIGGYMILIERKLL